MRLALLAVVLAACADPVTAYFAVPGSTQTDDFYALPFPNDLRRHDDGTLDLSELPTNSPIAMTVRDIAATNDGFGLNAALFARFSGALDPETLPSPAESMTEAASVYLVDVDPDSPTRGERSPVIATFRPDGTVTIQGNRLVVRPYPGFPLADGTTYALVITNRVGGADGADVERASDFSALMTGGGNAAIAKARTVYAPLLDWLDEPGGDERGDVVSAAVFTTQHATQIVPAVRKGVYSTPAPTADNVVIEVMGSTFYLITGTYTAPNFQVGEPAYINSGGNIEVGDDGAAIVQRMEPMRFALAVPNGPVPPTGFPICIYQHGTTGDWKSFFQEGTADRLTAQGIAVISTDQVLHEGRGAGTDPSIAFYNLNNPVAGRDNPLQGAADAWSQLRLATGLSIPDGGRTITLDPDRVYFWGHSQGGQTGPGFVAFEPSVDGAVLSGTGGVFYLNILHKTEPLDFPSLVTTLVRDDPVDADNPTLALAQMMIERSDPVNYAQFMVRKPQLAPDGTTTLAPRNIFQTEGFTDHYSPNIGIEAFATAIGGDLVDLPDAAPVEGLTLRGRSTLSTPATQNYPGVTAVLAQYKMATGSDGHFVAQDIDAARKQTAQFLGTLAATGQATVVSP